MLFDSTSHAFNRFEESYSAFDGDQDALIHSAIVDEDTEGAPQEAMDWLEKHLADQNR